MRPLSDLLAAALSLDLRTAADATVKLKALPPSDLQALLPSISPEHGSIPGGFDVESARTRLEKAVANLIPARGSSPPDPILLDLIERLWLRRCAPGLHAWMDSPDDALSKRVTDLVAALDHPDSHEALIGLASHPDPLRRCRAAEALGMRGEPRSFEPLCALLNDADPDVCESAAMGLGDLRDPRAAGPLLKALGSPTNHRKDEFFFALGKVGNRSATEALLPYLCGSSEDLRALAAGTLLDLEASECLADVARLLDSDEANVRMSALTILAENEEFDLFPVAVELLSDPASFVRSFACRLLAERDWKAGVESIAPLLEDEEPYVRGPAALALGKLGANSYADSIAKLLGDSEPAVLWRSIRALGLLQANRHERALKKYLNHPNADVREAALESCFDMNPRQGRAEGMASLKDPDEKVRILAARLVAGGGDSNSLLPLLEDPHPLVRIRTAEALIAAGSPSGISTLLAECRSRQYPARYASAVSYFSKSLQVLNRFRKPDAWDRLQRLPTRRYPGGSPRNRLEHLARQAGFEVEWTFSPTEPRLNTSSRARMDPKATLESLLGASLDLGLTRYDLVLEEDRIRVFRAYDAVLFWESWWRRPTPPRITPATGP